MKLNLWIKKSKLRQREFARRLGITESHMSYLLDGKRKPSLRLAKKIIRATGGEVTITDL